MASRPDQICELENGVRRILAPNPSPMTYWGTNSYLIGTGSVALIDPGPNDPEHQKAILGALNPGEIISHIFVTHSHTDHSPLARAMADYSAAPILAFGGPTSGRSKVMEKLVANGMTGGGEGIDRNFQPDIELHDGQTTSSDSWSLTAIWTPGHIGNHLCLAWDDRLFVGDHVMGWASSLVSPPDGDLTDFMASLHKLKERRDRIYYPGHGDPIDFPQKRLDWLLNHRMSREKSILRELSDAPADVKTLTRRIYHDIGNDLHAAAERNVLAHLIDLTLKDQVEPIGTLSPTVAFRRL